MNPNASEFQFNPSGEAVNHESVTESSFTEYANMVESIEQEIDDDEANGLVEAMNDVAVQPAGPPPATGLPAHLAKHAAEFWFPECRNCTCCNGFKHGCQCAAANGGVCTCSAGTAPPVAVAPAPAGGKKVLCKFFLSPGGCRFGDKCRFAHA
mmetsp:Transcript_41118/g.63332  ORF Transcript_41118/g.63332 Transcript_41118/m.63332 type:complete len:153 (+) Transcript_41118:161-619(+)|eukprot:CAMPEP_0117027250 /NCGR_PEP_ID=MMETSP0472-20121206/19936_1 /TAXON_ID=693140 ORGANISM="Tiarina fusus, Strain LIS" /NCGR_SAMPLE_ID=MMETSP0472 /ASSEMBLY_ACC=CAM_ASM_000603 /LENGTH=152 /DNA_ID=CAMNT_0004734443 /DNA_START=161 /DNA_END=619 /DNA_ORIENTATION=-